MGLFSSRRKSRKPSHTNVEEEKIRTASTVTELSDNPDHASSNPASVESVVAEENNLSDSSEKPPAYTVMSAQNNQSSFDADFVPPTIEGLVQESDGISTENPSHAQCLTHLKLLMAIHKLRTEISNTNGLFGISMPESTTDDFEDRQAKIKEKKWAVYVTRAVERFTVWWQNCIPATTGLEPSVPLCSVSTKYKERTKFTGSTLRALQFNENTMPPLDVLMVWHAYTLNPRNFLEDCMRSGKMDFWAAGIPWAAVNMMIDPITFNYRMNAAGTADFQELTQIPAENLDMKPHKTIICPTCTTRITKEWTNAADTGFADTNFHATCTNCLRKITHQIMEKDKFLDDLEALKKDWRPLPGTTLSVRGLFDPPKQEQQYIDFTNKLMHALYEEFFGLLPDSTLLDVTDIIAKGLKDKKVMRQATNLIHPVLVPLQKVAIRRCMAHYWSNTSPFGLNLVGAVIRQGSFISKMADIDWYHSVSVHSTIDRLITRYHRFFQIMKSNIDKVIVPTLDIDLAWHTHQTQPSSYYEYSVLHTRRFIDHDDKIDEGKLSKAFEFTSKRYERKYHEAYSECACWYCQTIRESHRSSSLFGSSNTSTRLPHDVTDDSPRAHISSHSAVRITDDATAEKKRQTMEQRLDLAYERLSKKAQKEGKPVPKKPDYRPADASTSPIHERSETFVRALQAHYTHQCRRFCFCHVHHIGLLLKSIYI